MTETPEKIPELEPTDGSSWEPGTGAADPFHRCRGAAGVHRCSCETGKDHGPGDCKSERPTKEQWLDNAIVIHVNEPPTHDPMLVERLIRRHRGLSR